MKLLAFCFLLLAGVALAQDYPGKPVRLIVPYAAGGLPDTMSRLVAPKLAEALGQQLLVENRPGAGGISGTEAVARAAPDGYTLLIADVGQLAINPHIFSKLPYDALKDLAPVSLLGTSTLFLVLHASVPANSFQELVALAKARPGSLNYGSSGLGSIHHVTTEAFKQAFGLDIVHVPYKGMGQAVPALLGGQVSMVFSALPAVEGHVQGGKVKLLALSTPQRSAQAPQVPTIAELGAPGFDFAPQIGMLAPAGTPQAIVQRLSAEVGKAVRLPDVSQRFQTLGIDPAGNSPQEYATSIRNAYERYGKAVRTSGIRVE